MADNEKTDNMVDPEADVTTDQGTDKAPDGQEISSKRKMVGTVSLIGSHAISDGLIDMLNPIYSTIASTTGITITAATSLATTMNFFNSLFKLPSGVLLSKVGKTRLLMVLGLLVQSLALIALTYFQGLTGMLISVAVLGIAWSIYHPASYSLVALLLNKNRRTLITTYHNISGSVGPLVYVAAIGALTVMYGWQWAVRIICIVSIILTILVFFTLPKKVDSAPGKDSISTDDKKKKTTILEMGKGIIANKNLMLICLLGAIRGFTHRGVTVFIPIFLATQLAWSIDQISYLYSFMVACGIAGQFCIGFVGDRIGLTRVLMGLLVGTGLCVVGVATVTVVPMLVFFILTIGFFNYGIRPIMWSFAIASSTKEAMPMSMSALDFSNQSLATLSPVLGGVVVDFFGIRPALAMYAATYFLAGLIAVYMNYDAKKNSAKKG